METRLNNDNTRNNLNEARKDEDRGALEVELRGEAIAILGRCVGCVCSVTNQAELWEDFENRCLRLGGVNETSTCWIEFRFSHSFFYSFKGTSVSESHFHSHVNARLLYKCLTRRSNQSTATPFRSIGHISNRTNSRSNRLNADGAYGRIINLNENCTSLGGRRISGFMNARGGEMIPSRVVISYGGHDSNHFYLQCTFGEFGIVQTAIFLCTSSSSTSPKTPSHIIWKRRHCIHISQPAILLHALNNFRHNTDVILVHHSPSQCIKLQSRYDLYDTGQNKSKCSNTFTEVYLDSSSFTFISSDGQLQDTCYLAFSFLEARPLLVLCALLEIPVTLTYRAEGQPIVISAGKHLTDYLTYECEYFEPIKQKCKKNKRHFIDQKDPFTASMWFSTTQLENENPIHLNTDVDYSDDDENNPEVLNQISAINSDMQLKVHYDGNSSMESSSLLKCNNILKEQDDDTVSEVSINLQMKAYGFLHLNEFENSPVDIHQNEAESPREKVNTDGSSDYEWLDAENF